MGRFAQLMLDAAEECRLDVALMVSRQNEDLHSFDRYGSEKIIQVDTFRTGGGALIRIDRICRIRKRLAREIRARRASRVIFLMPHVWGPLMSGVIRKHGAHYGVVVHDAAPHPGDPTGRVHDWIHVDLERASRVFTLSHWVADELLRRRPVLRGRIAPLMHPDLGSGAASCTPDGEPIRLGFLGRILPYKGLALFVEAVEALQADGVPFKVQVVGEGDLEAFRARLERVGAQIKNKWVSEEELAHAARQSDLVVASHLEASQSGVVAFALGHGIPVLVTPVGALPEQVSHDVNGLIAREASASAIAEQIKRAVRQPELLGQLREGVAQTAKSRSMTAFLQRLLVE